MKANEHRKKKKEAKYNRTIVLSDDDMKIILFNFYNFAGTPQTEEHKEKLQNLLKL